MRPLQGAHFSFSHRGLDSSLECFVAFGAMKKTKTMAVPGAWSLANRNPEKPIFSYGALRDNRPDVEAINCGLRTAAAVAYVRGDKVEAVRLRNEIWTREHALLRERSLQAKTKGRARRRPAGQKRGGGQVTQAKGSPNREICWYCPALASEVGEVDIDAIAMRSVERAKKFGLDRRDVFAYAIAAWMCGKGYEKLPAAVRANRSVSAAIHQLMGESNIEHPARERAILGAEYQKWTPRMTPKRKVAYLLATYVQ